MVPSSWAARITALCYPAGFHIQLKGFKNCLIFLASAISQTKHCDCSGYAALCPLPRLSTGKSGKLRYCPWQKQLVKFSDSCAILWGFQLGKWTFSTLKSTKISSSQGHDNPSASDLGLSETPAKRSLKVMDVFPKLQYPLLSSSWGAELTYPRKISPTARPQRTTRRFLYCRFYQIWIQEPSTWEEVEPGVKGTNLTIIFKAWKILIIDESTIYCYVNNYHSGRNLWDFLTGSRDKPTLIHMLNKLLE